MWCARDEVYLTLGSWADSAPFVSDYTGRDVYYQSIRQLPEDYLTVRDYLWRWDTDWFWCSRAFGAQNPTIRRLWPKQWLRSNVYWKLVALERRYGVKARIDRARGKPELEYVIQDIEVPVARLGRVPRLPRPADRHGAGMAVPAACSATRTSRGTSIRSTRRRPT